LPFKKYARWWRAGYAFGFGQMRPKALSLDTQIVLVHDAARPFVDRAMVDRLLIALKKNRQLLLVCGQIHGQKIERRTLNIQKPGERFIMEAQRPRVP